MTCRGSTGSPATSPVTKLAVLLLLISGESPFWYYLQWTKATLLSNLGASNSAKISSFLVSLPAEVSNPLPGWAWAKKKAYQVLGYIVISYLSLVGCLSQCLKLSSLSWGSCKDHPEYLTLSRKNCFQSVNKTSSDFSHLQTCRGLQGCLLAVGWHPEYLTLSWKNCSQSVNEQDSSDVSHLKTVMQGTHRGIFW